MAPPGPVVEQGVRHSLIYETPDGRIHPGLLLVCETPKPIFRILMPQDSGCLGP